MTRKEAIQVLNMVEAHGLADEAKRMAIEALSADAPSGDLISRQEAAEKALQFFIEYLGGAFDEDGQMLLVQRMNEIPSAEPVHGEWKCMGDCRYER